MNAINRFVLVLLSWGILLIGLAYSGVRLADKPATWMPVVSLVCVILLIIGITWAYYPVLMKIEAPLTRYTIYAALTILSSIVTAFLGYVFFVNMWLVFGVQL